MTGERPAKELASPAPDFDGVEPRKVQLMEVTEELLARHGYDGLRLRDVAKKAGVSVGSIQHWFESREALVLDTLSYASWRRAAEFLALQDGLDDPVEQVHALLRGSIADRTRCQEWLETCVSATRHDELVPMIERIYEAWRLTLRRALDDGVAAGAFTPLVPLDEVLDTVMVMIDGLMVAVSLQLYAFDEPYVTQLLEQSTGRLLGYDFTAQRPVG